MFFSDKIRILVYRFYLFFLEKLVNHIILEKISVGKVNIDGSGIRMVKSQEVDSMPRLMESILS